MGLFFNQKGIRGRVLCHLGRGGHFPVDGIKRGVSLSREDRTGSFCSPKKTRAGYFLSKGIEQKVLCHSGKGGHFPSKGYRAEGSYFCSKRTSFLSDRSFRQREGAGHFQSKGHRAEGYVTRGKGGGHFPVKERNGAEGPFSVHRGSTVSPVLCWTSGRDLFCVNSSLQPMLFCSVTD